MRTAWIGLLAMAIAPAVAATDIDIYAGIEQFTWAEFEDGGGKLLDETGQRQYVGILGTNHLSREWSIDFGGRVYSATVDYDGQTMSGQPVTTDTDYNGYMLELGFLHYTASRRKIDTGEWVIRFAVGFDRWRRSLQDSSLSDGTPVSGYVERYTSNYARLGATWVRPDWSAGFGAKAPFYTSEEVDVGGTNISLNPEGQLSLYAGVKVPLNDQWGIAVDYDSYRFAKSDPDNGYYQPESEQDTFGASVHYRF